jgi:4a-hydroxytetrahydrobiopterin dehydratase
MACQSVDMQTLSTQEFLDARLDDWRKLAQGLHTRYVIPDFAAGAAFVSAVAEAAEAVNHHPDVTLRYGHVDLSLSTHEDGRWVTVKDVELARQISELAARHGLRPEPRAVAQLEVGLDTADEFGISPFWAVLLTGDAANKVFDSVLDPSDRVPNIWFQTTQAHQTPRQRWHFDLWLAPEVADERIAAAVAAGGTVVDDEHAPSFTVLADPEGNRVCICTCLDRP